MKIGIIDVDGYHKKKKFGATIYPNLALCKISAYHKAKGDSVEWYDPMFTGYCDIIYLSKIFSFSPDYDAPLYADVVKKGGTGYDIKSKLDKAVDDMQPDLSIYPNIPANTSYGFLTRGCPNKCRWCVVPRKEGAIVPYWDIDRVANGNTNIVLMDNNILAAGKYAVEQLQKIIERGYKVDFNQALDARLVTDEYAKLLARVKWINNTIRFGCDTTKQIRECEAAIEKIRKYGFKGSFFLYTILIGDFKENYERVRYWWLRNHKAREEKSGLNVYPYAQPYLNPDSNEQKIPQWQKDLAAWVNKRMIFESVDFKDYQPRKGFKCSNYIELL